MASFGWDRITRAWTSQEGSAGVVFVSLDRPCHMHMEIGEGRGDLEQEERTVVIKSSSRVAEEIFANRIAQIVGVPVPQMRLVEYVSTEWLDIKERLHEYIVMSSEKGNDCNHVAQKLRSELNRPYFLVMEFVKGNPLECNYNLPTILSAPASRELFLASFGLIIAFDTLLNNSDRIPFVHNNEGNASNILITDTGECVAIDTCLTSIHPTVSKTLLERHVQKVESMYSILLPILRGNYENEEIKQKLETAALKRLETVKDFIWRATAYQISDDITLAIGREIIRGIRLIVTRLVVRSDLSVDLRCRFSEVKEEIQTYVTEDWECVWERSLQLVNLDYLETMLGAFRRLQDISI